MNQHITVEQLKQLKSDQKVCKLNTLMGHEWNLIEEEFRKCTWYKILEDTAKYCTIGKMLEVLQQNNSLKLEQENVIPNDSDYGLKWVVRVFHDIDCPIKEYEAEELCDALWEAVKEVL